MALPVINSRADLDAIAGMPEHAKFIANLKGSLTRRENVAIYPADYDHRLQPDQPGYIAPIWADVEDLSTIVRFGFTRAEIEALP